MEYTRYARELSRKDHVWVLTGTATLHRASVLRLAAAARGAGLPGPEGDVYDSAALTEDMEINARDQGAGYRVSSPPRCKVVTEVMPTWSALFRAASANESSGAVENLRTYGAS